MDDWADLATELLRHPKFSWNPWKCGDVRTQLQYLGMSGSGAKHVLVNRLHEAGLFLSGPQVVTAAQVAAQAAAAAQASGAAGGSGGGS